MSQAIFSPRLHILEKAREFDPFGHSGLTGTTAQGMTPDSFLSMLLSHEWDYRAQAAVTRLTKNASFRYKAYL